MSAVILRGSFGTPLEPSGEKKWNLLFPRGEWHGANLKPIGGSIVIDDKMLNEMVANWRDAGRPPLPIRRTHLHLDGDVPAADRPELEAAFGLLEDLRVTSAGLEVLTDWNDAGRAEVQSGRFNFWSPEWQPAHTDRRTGEVKGWWLSGTALTNDPFFNSMPRVAASTAPAVATSTHQPTKEQTMTPELKKRLKMALKCAEDTSDDDLVASVERMSASFETKPGHDKGSPDGQPKVGASTTDTEKLTAAIQSQVAPLVAQVEKLTADVKSRDEKLQEQAIEQLIAAAKAEGRAVEPLRTFIVAAFKSGGADLAGKLIATAPKVPLTEKGLPGSNEEKTHETARAQLTAAAADIVKASNGTITMSEARITASLKHPELAATVAKQLITVVKES